MQRRIEFLETLLPTTADSLHHALQKQKNVVNHDIISAISQNQSTSETISGLI
jgi:hypothetical protein